jgi:two-component system, NarL family, response regulator DevR
MVRPRCRKLAMYVRDDFPRTDLNEWPAFTANQVGSISRNWNILLVSNVGDGGDATLLRSLVLKNLPRHVIRASNAGQAKSYIANAVFNAIVVCLEPTATAGLEACRELSTEYPEIPILLLTRDLDDELLGRCVVSGAQDCLAYDNALRGDLRRAIRLSIDRVMQRRTQAPAAASASADIHAVSRVAQLTDRQRQVLELLVQGKPLKQIAALLDIGVQTATKHRAQILKRCQVDSVAQLVRLSFAAGLSSV